MADRVMKVLESDGYNEEQDSEEFEWYYPKKDDKK